MICFPFRYIGECINNSCLHQNHSHCAFPLPDTFTHFFCSLTKGEGGDILDLVRIPLESASVSASASASAGQNLVPTISLEPVDGIPPNVPGYITGTSLRAD